MFICCNGIILLINLLLEGVFNYIKLIYEIKYYD